MTFTKTTTKTKPRGNTMMEKINNHLIENGNVYITIAILGTSFSFAVWFIYDTVVNGL